jgi:hypothetical protein
MRKFSQKYENFRENFFSKFDENSGHINDVDYCRELDLIMLIKGIVSRDGGWGKALEW